MYFDWKPSSAAFKKNVLNFLNPFCTEECLRLTVDGRLQCDCGNVGIFEWKWDKQEDASVLISQENREIIFHPVYSSGTAALRGNRPFEQNQHYYWEMKMLSNLYGTDVMVGVGTSKIVLSDWKYKFFSLLGSDEQSWGYSYNGTIQHKNISNSYGKKFGIGSLIGAHLDMCKGTLEYYLNRKPLGVAFTHLKSKELYPMVCSTAAQSAMKTTCAVSIASTLQLKCLQCIVKHPQVYEQFKSIPGLARIYERKYFWLLPKEWSKRKTERKSKSQGGEAPKRKKLYIPSLNLTYEPDDDGQQRTMTISLETLEFLSDCDDQEAEVNGPSTSHKL